MPFKFDLYDRPTNRAQSARLRRSQRSQQRVSTANNRSKKPTGTRPVVVRGNAFGTPILRKAGKQRARRQFYLTMDQAGSELRLPAIGFVKPGWRLISSLLVILALVGIFSMLDSPFFQVGVVEVKGLQRLSPDDLTSPLNLANLSIIEVDRRAALQILAEAFPELKDIQVQVFMPNVVTISAVERQPVLAWQKGEAVSWVDAEGVVFPARGEASVGVTVHSESDLPLLAPPPETQAASDQKQPGQAEEKARPSLMETLLKGGSQPTEEEIVLQKVDPVLIAAAQGLSQQLPAETTIVYEARHGLGWNDPQGWQVYIGKDLIRFEDKYSTYQNIVNYLANQGLQPTLVSVEHLDAPFYRLEQ